MSSKILTRNTAFGFPRKVVMAVSIVLGILAAITIAFFAFLMWGWYGLMSSGFC